MDDIDKVIWVLPFSVVLDIASSLYVESSMRKMGKLISAKLKIRIDGGACPWMPSGLRI